MDKIIRLDYLRTEHAALCDKIAYDKFLLASNWHNTGEEAALKERIQHMEWVADDYLKQIEARVSEYDPHGMHKYYER